MISLLQKTASRLWKTWQVEHHNRGLKMSPPIVWDFDEVSAIEIGEGVEVGAFGEFAVRAKSEFSTVSGSLHIGNQTQIGSACNIRACGGRIEIGENCLIAQHVSLIAANHTFRAGAIYRNLDWETSRCGIRIGDNVWIGAGVIVLPGCRIGDNSIVAAGSVVTKDIPSNEIWGNIPARMMRKID